MSVASSGADGGGSGNASAEGMRRGYRTPRRGAIGVRLRRVPVEDTLHACKGSGQVRGEANAPSSEATVQRMEGDSPASTGPREHARSLGVRGVIPKSDPPSAEPRAGKTNGQVTNDPMTKSQASANSASVVVVRLTVPDHVAIVEVHLPRHVRSVPARRRRPVVPGHRRAASIGSCRAAGNRSGLEDR